jgi:hypothetical protein
MSNFEIISHKPYMQRNYIPVTSVKQTVKNQTSILLICIRLSQNIYCVKRTMSAIRGNKSKFCLSGRHILIPSQYCPVYTRIIRILVTTFCPLSSADLYEVTTLVVCTTFNFVPSYSSVTIQQQFLIPCTQMYIEICQHTCMCKITKSISLVRTYICKLCPWSGLHMFS